MSCILDISAIEDWDFNDFIPSEESCMDIKSINIQQNKLRIDKGNVKQSDKEMFWLSPIEPKPQINLIDEINEEKRLGMKIEIKIQDILTQTKDQSKAIFNFRNRHCEDYKRVLIKDSIKMDSSDILKLINWKSHKVVLKQMPKASNEISCSNERDSKLNDQK